MNTEYSFRRVIGVIVVLSLALTAAVIVQAQERAGDRAERAREQRVDARYNHNRAYPVRGYATARLPETAVATRFRGRPYYFDRGVWYRPYAGRYAVVDAPFGIALSVLPPFYTTIWFSGVPYYYANDTYYLWSADQQSYVVSAPPQDPGAATAQPPQVDQLFIYPKNGQSAAQQASDRYECHAWARQQSGFDPTESLGGVDGSKVAAKHSEYQRAEQACLESHGYTVR